MHSSSQKAHLLAHLVQSITSIHARIDELEMLLNSELTDKTFSDRINVLSETKNKLLVSLSSLAPAEDMYVIQNQNSLQPRSIWKTAQST